MFIGDKPDAPFRKRNAHSKKTKRDIQQETQIRLRTLKEKITALLNQSSADAIEYTKKLITPYDKDYAYNLLIEFMIKHKNYETAYELSNGLTTSGFLFEWKTKLAILFAKIGNFEKAYTIANEVVDWYRLDIISIIDKIKEKRK